MQILLTPHTLASLLKLLARARPLEGVVVELGVYQGGALKAMAEAVPEKTCYGFDTFSGQPAASWREGDVHRPGEFADTSLETVRAAMPANVVLVPGWFPQSAVGTGPRICFAHVDMDLEQSTADAIAWLLPRMVPGGLVVFDDWGWRNCPGVVKAIARAGLPVVRSNVHQCYWIASPSWTPESSTAA
jgi:O-methyltransferase